MRLLEPKANKFILRFDADKNVGIGHFKRCYALGCTLELHGFRVLYIFKYYEESIIDFLEKRKCEFCIIPEMISWRDEFEYIFKQGITDICGFILDISTPFAFNDPQGIKSYFNQLDKNFLLILIDGMGDNELLSRIDTRVDILVVPYFGAQAFEFVKATKCLAGPEYFIFGSDYLTFPIVPKQINATADKLLVTLGGSDPFNVTIDILNSIISIKNRRLIVRVVIGPNFDGLLQEKIKSYSELSRYEINVINSPDSLLEHMLWCDMAITSSGLTKYEMALTGTPSLQISFSEDYATVNEAFIKNSTAKHLGVYDNVSTQSLSKEIEGLLDDKQNRKRMSSAGQHLLDGRGTKRIMEVIKWKL